MPTRYDNALCYSWAAWKKGDEMSKKPSYSRAIRLDDKFIGRAGKTQNNCGGIIMEGDIAQGCILGGENKTYDEGEYLICT